MDGVKLFIKLFLGQSSIHGFYHLSRRYHVVETIIWLALIASAIYGAAVLSTLTLHRYIENPTVISMERDRFSWNTTFPAATVCPTFKINQELLELYVKNSVEKNKTQLRLFLTTLAEAGYENFDKVVEYDGITEEQYMDILLDLKFEFKPYVTNSGTNSRLYEFQRVVTEMGICYSFNSQLAVYNSPE